MTTQAAEAVAIIGFDSAWTDSRTAPGALCIIRIDAAGRRTLVPPSLVSFDQALAVIGREKAPLRLVALDQPTIVPNATGMRPVDRVAASVIAWLGGGVQPANRAKVGMFDDAAPLWRFKERLGAAEDPETSRDATAGLFLMEVFPALALASLDPAFCGRRLGPRYNPARSKTFTLTDWHAVIGAVRRSAEGEAIFGLAEWADELARNPIPRKADQDRLDAILCAVIGLLWLTAPREASIMIGDRATGYMIAPANPEVRLRLSTAAAVCGVSVDADRRPEPIRSRSPEDRRPISARGVAITRR
jgi:predicted RNase H-like nuclease